MCFGCWSCMFCRKNIKTLLWWYLPSRFWIIVIGCCFWCTLGQSKLSGLSSETMMSSSISHHQFLQEIHYHEIPSVFDLCGIEAESMSEPEQSWCCCSAVERRGSHNINGLLGNWDRRESILCLRRSHRPSTSCHQSFCSPRHVLFISSPTPQWDPDTDRVRSLPKRNR